MLQTNFETALSLMKSGARMKRLSWKGKKTAVYAYAGEVSAEPINVPVLLVETTIGSCGPWTPTQCDLFANDWIIVGKEEAAQ